MRENWLKLVAWTGFLLILIGCRSPRPNVKPPYTIEQYNKPPEEARYNNFPTYPKDSLDMATTKKKDAGPLGPPSPSGIQRPGGPGGI